MKRSWLYHISPCILAAVISVIGIIAGIAGKESSGGWSFILIIIFLPALIILLAADWVVKTVTKGNVLYIWIIEIILIIILVLCIDGTDLVPHLSSNEAGRNPNHKILSDV